MWTTPSSLGERLIDRVRPEVDRVVAELRPLCAPLAVEHLAARLGVELATHRFRGPVRGAAVGDRLVILDERLQGARRAEVFGHEVGHVLHHRGCFSAIAGEEAELFADQFARELLVPGAWLRAGRDDARQLCRMAGVTQAQLAMQLGAAGLAPAVLRDGSRTLCASCGEEMHDRRCVCRPYRESRRLRRGLPDLRTLPAFVRPPADQLVLAGCDVAAPKSPVIDWGIA